MSPDFVTLLNYLLVFNVFGGAFILFRQSFEFYVGYVFIILFLIMYVVQYRKFKINLSFLTILTILTATSIYNVIKGNVTLFLMTKQVVGILITGAAYYLLVKFNNCKVDKLFRIYMQIALVVAAIGLFQEFSYLVKFEIGYDFRWMPSLDKWACYGATRMGLLRVNSVFYEPSHFAVFMAPAFFASFLDIFKKNPFFFKSIWASMIIAISYMLTFSLIAYIAILISIIIIIRSKGPRYLILAAIIISILVFAAYYYVPDISMRIDAAVNFVKHPSVDRYTHMSIYSVASNAFVAFNAFRHNFLFGYGLGSHPVSYDKYFDLGISTGFMRPTILTAANEEVCKGDSGSLILRLLSETGLFGVVVVLYFIFRFRLNLRTDNSITIINNAIFILFILQLLRIGHYFYNGLFFFVWVYYFTYKIHGGLDLKEAAKDK